MKLDCSIKHGANVKDMVTGVCGTVSSISRELNGNYRIGIQPTTTDNKLVEAILVDEATVDVLGFGLISSRAPEPRESPVEPGQVVRDRASGAQGMVSMVTWHLNGCVYVSVVSDTTDKGVPRNFTMPVERAEIVNQGIAKVTVEASPEGKPPGGPVERAPILR